MYLSINEDLARDSYRERSRELDLDVHRRLSRPGTPRARRQSLLEPLA